MLGIGKIRPDTTTYHLDAVADGVEDYYFSSHEAPGTWAGAAAVDLGLAGTVTREQLVRLLEGRQPASGELLGTVSQAHGGRPPLPGYDVALRAPKSVSLLWGLTTDDGLRAEVEAGHDAAVTGALRYLEAVAAVARRGSHGSTLIRASGFVAAAFRHRTSRAGDPVLHTHLVIPNVVKGDDGRWSAPDGRLLYANGKSAGYVYQALLRGELTRRLGVVWGPIRNGCADLDGTPPSVIRAFSRRRQDIELRRDEVATKHGESAGVAAAAGPATTVTPSQIAAETAEQLRGARATSQLAALETRRAKDDMMDMPSMVAEWRERAAGLEYTEESRREQLGRQCPAPMTLSLYQTMAARLVGESHDDPGDSHLAVRASTFHRRDAVMGWCSQLAQGATSVGQIEDLTNHFLCTHPAIVRLTAHDGLDEGRAAEPIRTGAPRFTTRLMRALEMALVASGAERQGDGIAVAGQCSMEAAIRRFTERTGKTLTTGQDAAVHRMSGSGAGVDVVVGRAGTGKTTALSVARDAWQASGILVAGAAKAAAAARNLELTTGIPSRTLDALLLHPDGPGLRHGDVLVVDEAAMTETRTLARLLLVAEEHRWKVVLVGDDHQLREIDSGGGFRGLRERLGAVTLDENLRQQAPWEREAIDLVRAGRGVDAMLAYVSHDRVGVGPTHDDGVRLMVDRWWERHGDGRLELLQARRNVDVAELNGLIHDRRVAAGEVSRDGLRVGGVQIGVGDRVLTRVTSYRDGIINGLRGQVVGIKDPPRDGPGSGRAGGTGLVVQIDDGAELHVSDGYLQRSTDDGLPALDLAYATTVHRNQGATAERSQTLIDRGLTRDAVYVALSRGRMSNELVVAESGEDDVDGDPHWSQSGAPRRALETCVRAIENAAPKHLSSDTLSEDASAELPEPEAIDRLVAAWRESADRIAGSVPMGAAAASEVAPQPAVAEADRIATSDPHLLAIECLLDESRVDVIKASERYEAWHAAHLGNGGTPGRLTLRVRVEGAPVSTEDEMPRGATAASPIARPPRAG